MPAIRHFLKLIVSNIFDRDVQEIQIPARKYDALKSSPELLQKFDFNYYNHEIMGHKPRAGDLQQTITSFKEEVSIMTGGPLTAERPHSALTKVAWFGFFWNYNFCANSNNITTAQPTVNTDETHQFRKSKLR